MASEQLKTLRIKQLETTNNEKENVGMKMSEDKERILGEDENAAHCEMNTCLAFNKAFIHPG